jgi:hypothetical protein
MGAGQSIGTSYCKNRTNIAVEFENEMEVVPAGALPWTIGSGNPVRRERERGERRERTANYCTIQAVFMALLRLG